MTRAATGPPARILARDGDWADAASLADALGVTPRSIRSYVTAVNARVVPGGSPSSRARRATARVPEPRAALRATRRRSRHAARSPAHARARAAGRPRRHRRLRDGGRSCTSARPRSTPTSPACAALLGGTELTLERSAARARLRGTEMAQRRLLSRLAHDEMDAGSFDLEALRRTLGRDRSAPHAFGPFKTELVRRARRARLLRQRVRHRRCGHAHRDRRRPCRRATAASRGGAAAPAPRPEQVAAILARLAERTSASTLGAGDLQHLATLVLTRVVAPGAGRRRPTHARARLEPEVEAAVREVVRGRGSRVPRRHRARGLHPAPRAARAEPAAPRAGAGVVAQSAHALAEVDVSDDLRGRGLHRQRSARAARHPAPRRRDRLHRDAHRRPARAQPQRRPAPHRDDRVPRLLRAARAAALVGRPLARPGDRGHRRRDARGPRLGARSTPTSC